MKNSIYLLVVLFVFVVILFVAYSDWGRYPLGKGVMEDADASDRFSRQRFPETSGSRLPGLPQDLPPLEGLPREETPSQRMDRSRKDYEAEQWRELERRKAQQAESARRARHKRPLTP